jgi:hypothetical protein
MLGATRSLQAPFRASIRALRTVAISLLLVASVASCGSPDPTSQPSAPAAVPASSEAVVSTPSPTRTTRPTATPKPTSRATATPSPTTPPIAGATQTACPGNARTAHRGSLVTGLSRNWAGYVISATRGHVTCVEGTWTQPSVRCPAKERTSVAIWVGIDGSSAVGGIPDSSATLAQIGTIADCSDGRVQYSAWYEFLPDLRQIESLHLAIAAGDRIWAQVRWLGKGRFIATEINLTQRVGTTQTWTLSGAPLLTAEWVVEDPAATCSGGSCTFVTLARFATVTLNGALTISGTRYLLAGAPFPYLRTVISQSGRTLATPSSLSSHGFKVTWKAS